MNWYKRHIGDYIKDAAHLSLLEHGVYSRLLDVYYVREAGIPDDQAARLIGARSKEEKEALYTVLSEFFVLTEGLWTQSRCEREIGTASDIATTNRRIAEEREARKRALRETESSNEASTNRSQGVQRTVARTVHEPTTSQTPDSISHKPDSKTPESSVCPPTSSQGENSKGHTRAADPSNEFSKLKAAYPQFSGRQDWLSAEHYANLRIDVDGLTWPDLQQAVERYARYCAAGGVSSGQYVLTPAKFFSAADKPWLQPWDPPTPKAKPTAARAVDKLTWTPPAEDFDEKGQARVSV